MIATFARAEISQLDTISRNKNILRFDVPMKNALGMNIVDSFEQFIHVELDLLRLQIFIADQALIKILFHELEHER